MFDSWVMKKVLKAFENKDVGSIQCLLLQHSFSPNALIPSKGVSLLHLIIGHPSEGFALKITKLFLRCGGDPNVQSSDGVTPIHVAAAWGRNTILHLLLVNGGDPWVQDDEKKNAFNYAFEEKKWSTIEMLHHFQQMHSAALYKPEYDSNPKYEMDLERILLKKGEEMFAYVPPKKATKSMTTQTQSAMPDSSPSPIQEKIRYFDPANISKVHEVSCEREFEKGHMGWIKDFYQTPGEVIVHCEAPTTTTTTTITTTTTTPQKEPVDTKPETYISTVCMDTSPNSEKTKEINSSLDVRSQLFVELQEAVRRRTKNAEEEQNPSSRCDSLIIVNDSIEKQPATNKKSKTGENEQKQSDSIVVVNDSIEKDSFVAKEVSYLYGINLEDNGLLKNMSDFATKVMKEIEIGEEEAIAETTVDLYTSSPDLSNNYMSCDEKTKFSSVHTLNIPQNDSDSSNLFLTPYNSNISGNIPQESKEGNSNESFLSVTEEYKYSDPEEGVVLLERKLLLTPTISLNAGEEEEEKSDISSVSSVASSVPSCVSYNSDVLRCELRGLGYNPGPVTKTTKKLYLKKLWRLKKKVKDKKVPEKENTLPVNSPVVKKSLTDSEYFENIPSFQHLEEEMCLSFENLTKKKWREGTNKTSFNYLLLDPRISLNLPKRAISMTKFEAWKCFISAIFYVGKGKRSRPYAHLYQAASFWENRCQETPDEKTRRILEIWKEGLGVVCLQVFQNTIPVEALTREASMIDALALEKLKNSRGGEYYGVASTWRTKEKINLGIFLLHKAMLIFLSEGERQIKPFDID